MVTRKLSRPVMAAIALIAWFGLVLQLVLVLGNGRADGTALLTSLVHFFSFFTVLCNLLVAIVLTVSLYFPKTSLGGEPAQTATAVYIGLVGIGYSVLLRHIWDPQGWQKVADVLLHDAVPLLYVLWWVFLSAKKRLEWRSAFIWLIWPLVYLIYALIRGAVSGLYPYHFIDVDALGYGPVLIAAVGFCVAFTLLGLIAVALTRRQPH